MEILSKLVGILGIVVILGLCFLMSNNKKRINYKTVIVGLLIQFLLAVFIMKVPVGVKVFEFLASIINKILEASISGSNVHDDFYYGYC